MLLVMGGQGCHVTLSGRNTIPERNIWRRVRKTKNGPIPLNLFGREKNGRKINEEKVLRPLNKKGTETNNGCCLRFYLFVNKVEFDPIKFISYNPEKYLTIIVPLFKRKVPVS